MNIKYILLILVGIAIIGGLYWFELRTEPVEEITTKWSRAGHADATSESFTHWNEDDPPEIPVVCAKCHSEYGYLDYVGADGTSAGSVDNPARVGSLVSCRTCHNEPAHEKTTVVYPSGAEIAGLESETVCMDCHQGRRATDDVNEAIGDIGDDTVSEDLGFINVHYGVGAATKYGAEVRGAYQYANREYVGFFEHAEQYSTCTECHDAHSTSIEADKCSPCHYEVVDYGDIRGIRTDGVDYDGDGDTDEGISGEIATLHQALYPAIQEYAATVIEQPIIYADAFPYFFNDTNGNGEADDDEVNFGNQYTSWTPRLVRTTYNYHYVYEDPGNFAHNPRYVIQFLYDSLEDLGQQVDVDMTSMKRP